MQRSGRQARIDSYDTVAGPIGARVRGVGVCAAVGVPIIVDGRVWGLAGVGSLQPGPMPADTEARIGRFAELTATAVVAGYRDEQKRQLLAEASRRGNLAADNERRRIEHDLHDGAQQHLITLALDARAAEASAPAELAELKHQMSRIASGSAEFPGAAGNLRDIGPAILAKGGLPTAIKARARRSPVPVQLDVAITNRLPEPIQIAAYYLVAEALTNTAKHAHATTVDVQSTPTTPTPATRSCGSRCATTVAAAPTRTVAPGWTGSPTGWTPSAGASGYTAHPAEAPPCAPNSPYARPLRHGGALGAHAIPLLHQH